MEEKDFIYYAFVIEKSSKPILENFLESKVFQHCVGEHSDTKIFLHHMTILHCSQMGLEDAEKVRDFCERNLGVVTTLTIDTFGYSDNACAFGISKDDNRVVSLSMNDHPHITIATYNGGKPKDSNKIESWFPIHKMRIQARLMKF